MVFQREQQAWSPVQREAQTPRQEGRKPPSRMSAEEQQAWRLRVESAKQTAARENPRQESGESADNDWENRRQELVARGDIFDEKGNVTRTGQKVLIDGGWNIQQVLQMENLQRNYVAPVEVFRPNNEPQQERSIDTRSTEAARLGREARARAEQELADRTRREQEARTRAGERQRAGIRAYMNAIDRNMSDGSAEEARRQAEQAYDRQIADSARKAL